MYRCSSCGSTKHISNGLSGSTVACEQCGGINLIPVKVEHRETVTVRTSAAVRTEPRVVRAMKSDHTSYWQMLGDNNTDRIKTCECPNCRSLQDLDTMEISTCCKNCGKRSIVYNIDRLMKTKTNYNFEDYYDL